MYPQGITIINYILHPYLFPTLSNQKKQREISTS